MIHIGSIPVSMQHPFILIAGPCVVEGAQLTFDIAAELKSITHDLGIPFVFKASIDKANRTSLKSFRGLGWEQGLEVLSRIQRELSLPVLTDVHDVAMVEAVAPVVDVLQVPAFLCRQTDLIQAVSATGKPVNLKKGQFLSPLEMVHVVDKAAASGQSPLMVCERGVSFGYNNLVVDMRSLAWLRQTGCPVIFDATHSVQLPGAGNGMSGGQREFVPVLARAAVAVGIAGLFMETHPQPDKALSDGPNSWPLSKMRALLSQLKDMDALTKQCMQEATGDGVLI